MSLREVFWSGQLIYIQEIFLPVIIGALIFFPLLFIVAGLGYWRRARLWKLGQPEKRTDNWWQRLLTTLAVAIANIRIIRGQELFPGIMHALIFGGTALLVLGKIVRLFSYLTGITNPPQAVYLYASLVSEIGAAAIIIGGLVAVYRRYITKPQRLDTKPDDTLIFIWVGIVVLTGFMAKAHRIAAGDVSPSDWAMWSPMGYLLSHIFPTFLTEIKNDILIWHRALIHTVPAMVLLGYIWMNRSRLQHILLAPVIIFFRSLKPKGALTPVDFENTELFGVSKIEEFTWKQLMDLDACVRCGRCQDVCPAFASGKKLNPKKVIQDLKDHLYGVYPVPFLTKPPESREDMITEAVTEEVLWDCTTCRACQEACPIYVEHVDKIIDMRRNLAMERSQFPDTVQQALQSLQARMHPFRGTTATRTQWTEGLDVKIMAEDSDVDLLYWVGCSSALDERNMKIARAMAKILKAAGINFGILGDEEACCGDPARRIGDEYFFQTICQQNIEILNGYNVKKILTTCPHGYNSLKYEYPQFGGNFEVVHHTELIADLLRSGKLKLKKPIGKKAAYHDSCYLGRYNDIYDAPRDILKTVNGRENTELARNRSRGFCCGGGGGHMWLEEEPGQRVNEKRVEQVIDAGVDLVATACPFCMTMFDDGIKAKEMEETLHARDLCELVAEALEEQ
ncbi:heterodisulfide reductase-related iron-sulfur binding cluster [Chloroflexota bacterium]